MLKSLSLSALGAAALLLLAGAAPLLAKPVTLIDAAGRQVEIDAPAHRVLLGEGRQIGVVAALEGRHAFDTVVGWRDDLITKDMDTYQAYLAVFPDIGKLPRFGYVGNGTFNLEAAIALKPDVMTLNIESKEAADESGLEAKLAAAGIKLVYIDFRADPEANTERSILALGAIFDAGDKAQSFVDERRRAIARVTDVIAAHPDLKRPKVYLERAPGMTPDAVCCRTFGPLNFGRMIDLAGGHNIGADFIKTVFGELNPEQLIVSDPDIVMVTGANWKGSSDIDDFVSLGPGADIDKAREKLKGLMQSQPFASLSAVKAGRVFGIWHQFYGTPFDFVAVQQLAKWFHPDLFRDLDPQATFADFHKRYLPVAYRSGYFVTLNGGE